MTIEEKIPAEFKNQTPEIAKTAREVVRIKTVLADGELPFTMSKFGGKPFLLDKNAYPKSPDGKMLVLLAQINFAESPKIADFPEAGILQFFIADDSSLGLNFKNQTKQDGFRVIYYPKEVVSEDRAIRNFPFVQPDVEFVLSKEFALLFSAEAEPVSSRDFRFGRLLQLNDDADNYYKVFSGSGHKLGGYPFFTQQDPREFRTNTDYSTTLFQMDSEKSTSSNNYSIIWGDVGVANFFIKPEDLKACKFDNVLYNWDCY